MATRHGPFPSGGLYRDSTFAAEQDVRAESLKVVVFIHYPNVPRARQGAFRQGHGVSNSPSGNVHFQKVSGEYAVTGVCDIQKDAHLSCVLIQKTASTPDACLTQVFARTVRQVSSNARDRMIEQAPNPLG